jgi:chaperone BCS1
MHFQKAEPGDVLLLEDIDSAGIQREDIQTGKTKNSGVTLSGLLNAIDGGAAPEGLVLIMTSNNPESLDPALVRPGRIDVQILFGEVTQDVARSVFLRMYRDDDTEGSHVDEELLTQADIFAGKVPEKKITPAEVQGFLMNHTNPRSATANTDKWVEQMLVAMAAGKNIAGEYERADNSSPENIGG